VTKRHILTRASDAFGKVRHFTGSPQPCIMQTVAALPGIQSLFSLAVPYSVLRSAEPQVNPAEGFHQLRLAALDAAVAHGHIDASGTRRPTFAMTATV